MRLTTAILLGAAFLPTAFPAQAFTTAAEVRPILSATKSAWIAVREFEGNDLLYFTHLESWRCGLEGVKYGINSDVADRVWELETCYEGEAAPNAMKAEDRLPYVTLPLGSVESVTIEILYDDGTSDSALYERADVMTP
ncbi:MAG: hypothetical protein ACE5DK_03255 [Paracoccaceae bacterium]